MPMPEELGPAPEWRTGSHRSGKPSGKKRPFKGKRPFKKRNPNAKSPNKES
jgi:hypothetical protein